MVLRFVPVVEAEEVLMLEAGEHFDLGMRAERTSLRSLGRRDFSRPLTAMYSMVFFLRPL